MSEVAEKKKRNPGCIIAIVMIVLGAIAAYGGNTLLKPVAPAVILPAEPVWPGVWYHVTFAKEDLETILRIEADRFQNLAYPVEAFRTEARAVLGEYNKNSANTIQKLYETMRASAFRTHTYRHTTMGFIQDIEDMPNQYEYSKTFFLTRWYRPENTALIVAGDLDAAQVLPLVEKYWGGWKSSKLFPCWKRH